MKIRGVEDYKRLHCITFFMQETTYCHCKRRIRNLRRPAKEVRELVVYRSEAQFMVVCEINILYEQQTHKI